MGILEILILVALAVIIFIVIRRLPDTRVMNNGIKRKKVSNDENLIVRIKSLLSGLIGKIDNLLEHLMRRSKRNNIVENHEELTQQLKKPEDRDFWIENGDPVVNSKKSDLITKTYLDEAEDAFRAKDYRRAETLFIEVAKDHPHNVKVFNRLGIIYLEQKNYEDAIEAFSTALKYDSKSGIRFYNLALAHIGQGNYKHAVMNLKEAMKLSPENEKYGRILEQIEKK